MKNNVETTLEEKSTKALGIMILILGLLFLFSGMFYNETTPEDLITIEGEYDDFRLIRRTKTTTPVISLKNYPNNEFNLGTVPKLRKLLKELKIAPSKIIRLNIHKKFFQPEEPIIPAFYGIWLNGKEIYSDEKGFESYKHNRESLSSFGAFIILCIFILLIPSIHRRLF